MIGVPTLYPHECPISHGQFLPGQLPQDYIPLYSHYIYEPKTSALYRNHPNSPSSYKSTNQL